MVKKVYLYVSPKSFLLCVCIKMNMCRDEHIIVYNDRNKTHGEIQKEQEKEEHKLNRQKQKSSKVSEYGCRMKQWILEKMDTHMISPWFWQIYFPIQNAYEVKLDRVWQDGLDFGEGCMRGRE